ncbi:hepatocyte growth factor activator serine protease isoform X3 [Paroedura picta]|uniref:hepatocyte growth factor activator serine protease isoform X3 n=1 Tax=Paroedura picta TaxID=143630 RepID=UPI0040560FE0
MMPFHICFMIIVLGLAFSAVANQMMGNGHGIVDSEPKVHHPRVFTEAGQQCRFPFRHSGELYFSCITNAFSMKKWCSTTHNHDRDKEWGFCSTSSNESLGCVEPCGSFPCRNGGTCSAAQDRCSYHCSCPEEFMGETCEVECATNPCLHNGLCRKIISTGETICGCQKPFVGRDCNIDPSQRCYRRNATNYKGVVKKTAAGNHCLPWNSDLFYQELHLGTVENPLQLGLGPHSYCRNPDDDVQPWCYVIQDNLMSWGYCNVTLCASRGRLMPNPEIFEEFAAVRRSCGRRHKKRSFVRPRIIGGSAALPGSHPWLVAIYMENNFCAGSLIRACWVVTSAHCFANSPLKSTIQVVLGQHFFNKTTDITQEFEVEKYIMFPDYTVYNPTENDIVLVKLKKVNQRCAVKSKFVQPICLPENGLTFPDNWKCQIAGWGHLHENASSYSRVLQEAIVPVIPDYRCQHHDVYGAEISENMFCAGYLNSKSDACQGDSGGPLVCERDGISYLYGIVSWGDGCGRAKKPGVYTRVTKYLDWIKEITAPKD